MLLSPLSYAEKIYLESDGMVVMEAENTQTSLGTVWKLTTPSGYTGKGALENTANNPSSGPAAGPLNYTFKISKAGEYVIYLHIYKNLQGEASDKCNDVYVKVAGDYTAGSGGATLENLKKDNKLFGGNDKTCAWSGDKSLDVHDVKYCPKYNFKSGQVYTLTMSGRAQRCNVNRIIFATADAKTKAQNTSTPESKVEGVSSAAMPSGSMHACQNIFHANSTLYMSAPGRGNYAISLFSPGGKLMLKEIIRAGNAGLISLRTSTIPAGFYIAEITGAQIKHVQNIFIFN